MYQKIAGPEPKKRKQARSKGRGEPTTNERPEQDTGLKQQTLGFSSVRDNGKADEVVVSPTVLRELSANAAETRRGGEKIESECSVGLSAAAGGGVLGGADVPDCMIVEQNEFNLNDRSGNSLDFGQVIVIDDSASDGSLDGETRIEATQCPVCSRVLDVNIFKLNAHIDACLLTYAK